MGDIPVLVTRASSDNKPIVSEASGSKRNVFLEILAYLVILLAIGIAAYVWFVFNPSQENAVNNAVNSAAVNSAAGSEPLPESDKNKPVIPPVSDENKPVLSNCSDLNGFVCSDDSLCDGNLLDSSDSNSCCSIQCQQPAVQACSDNTQIRECSTNKPFYCDESANLVEKCNLCTCPELNVCDTSTGKCNPMPPPPPELTVEQVVQKFYLDINKVEITSFVVPSDIEYQVKVVAYSDKNVSYISLVDSNPYNNFEGENYNCFNSLYCFASFKVTESIPGSGDFNVTVVDSTGKEYKISKTVTVTGKCGNGTCDSSEAANTCPADCH